MHDVPANFSSRLVRMEERELNFDLKEGSQILHVLDADSIVLIVHQES